jgi:pre-mRNA-splicing factor SYF1
VIRAGIRRYTDEVGRLWQALAGYFIRLGQFEKARDVYDEAIQNVITVRDFTIVFDAYVLFEENILTAKISMHKDKEMEGEGERGRQCVCALLVLPVTAAL